MIRFQDALTQAIEFVTKNYTSLGDDPILVRDLYGRFRIVLPKKPKNFPDKRLARLFCERLGKFSLQKDAVFLYGDELFDRDAVFNSPEKIKIRDVDQNIYLLDRRIIGQDWLRPPISDDLNIPRVAVFGIKGGVGCSTALAVWAWHLAKSGKRVLAVDLDLESPGLGQILLPKSNMPDFGVADWLVEDAVGQADASLSSDMVNTSPLVSSAEGEIRVVPCAGSRENDYIGKLSRAYMGRSSKDGESSDFADRLARMLDALEQQEKPDIVLLDSRAGMHDIAAIAITRLHAYALLFAMNTPQTWTAYRLLFQHWQKWHPDRQSFRQNLKIVAGMTPETGMADYMERCRQSAYQLFSDTLYEEDSGEESNVEAFNFAENALDAPHYPLRINWNRAFQEFDPDSYPDVFTGNLITGAYGDFLREASLLALGEEPT